MTIMNLSALGVPLMWAGVSLGGNLVAAPAKFQVQALELPVALQVGRAQFTWIGYVEWLLFALVILGILVKLKVPPIALSIALVVFLIQQLWMQPLLETRTNLIVSGAHAGESHLHKYFVVAEIIKFAALLTAATMTASSLDALGQTR